MMNTISSHVPLFQVLDVFLLVGLLLHQFVLLVALESPVHVLGRWRLGLVWRCTGRWKMVPLSRFVNFVASSSWWSSQRPASDSVHDQGYYDNNDQHTSNDTDHHGRVIGGRRCLDFRWWFVAFSSLDRQVGDGNPVDRGWSSRCRPVGWSWCLLGYDWVQGWRRRSRWSVMGHDDVFWGTLTVYRGRRDGWRCDDDPLDHIHVVFVIGWRDDSGWRIDEILREVLVTA